MHEFSEPNKNCTHRYLKSQAAVLRSCSKKRITRTDRLSSRRQSRAPALARPARRKFEAASFRAAMHAYKYMSTSNDSLSLFNDYFLRHHSQRLHLRHQNLHHQIHRHRVHRQSLHAHQVHHFQHEPFQSHLSETQHGHQHCPSPLLQAPDAECLLFSFLPFSFSSVLLSLQIHSSARPDTTASDPKRRIQLSEIARRLSNPCKTVL